MYTKNVEIADKYIITKNKSLDTTQKARSFQKTIFIYPIKDCQNTITIKKSTFDWTF